MSVVQLASLNAAFLKVATIVSGPRRCVYASNVLENCASFITKATHFVLYWKTFFSSGVIALNSRLFQTVER